MNNIAQKFWRAVIFVVAGIVLSGCGASADSLINGVAKADFTSCAATVSYDAAFQLSMKDIGFDFGVKGTTKHSITQNDNSFIAHTNSDASIILPNEILPYVSFVSENGGAEAEGNIPFQNEMYVDYAFGEAAIYTNDPDKNLWIRSDISESLMNVTGVSNLLTSGFDDELRAALITPLATNSKLEEATVLFEETECYVVDYSVSGNSYYDMADLVASKVSEFSSKNPGKDIPSINEKQLKHIKEALDYIHASGKLYIDVKTHQLVGADIDFTDTDLNKLTEKISNAVKDSSLPTVSSNQFISNQESTQQQAVIEDIMQQIDVSLSKFTINIIIKDWNSTTVEIPGNIVNSAVDEITLSDIGDEPLYDPENRGNVKISIDPELLPYTVEEGTVVISPKEIYSSSEDIPSIDWEDYSVELNEPYGYKFVKNYDSNVSGRLSSEEDASEGAQIKFYSRQKEIVLRYMSDPDDPGYNDFEGTWEFVGISVGVTDSNGFVKYTPLRKYSFSYVDDGVEKEEVYLTAAYPDESEYFCVFIPGPQVQMADSLAGELFQNVRESTDEEMTVSENAAVSENVIEEE